MKYVIGGGTLLNLAIVILRILGHWQHPPAWLICFNAVALATCAYTLGRIHERES